MDEQLYEAGFRVSIDRCRHRVTLEIGSYESARVVANLNGALTFDCSDFTTLFETVIPTRETLKHSIGMLGELFGVTGEETDRENDDPDQHDTQILLFSDALNLELWLSSEFLPGLDVFNGEELEDEARTQIGKLTKDIMVDVLGNQARDRVRRDWR